MRDMQRALAVAAVIVLGVLGPGLAASAAPTGGRAYYVSPTGRDSGPGTINAPWRTLGRASTANLDPGDRLYLQGGSTFTGTLQLTMEDAGTSANPVIVDSYGAGPATISSGAGTGVSVHNVVGHRRAQPAGRRLGP